MDKAWVIASLLDDFFNAVVFAKGFDLANKLYFKAVFCSDL